MRVRDFQQVLGKFTNDMKVMWRRKWYELVKIIGRKLDESEIKRSAANSRKIH